MRGDTHDGGIGDKAHEADHKHTLMASDLAIALGVAPKIVAPKCR